MRTQSIWMVVSVCAAAVGCSAAPTDSEHTSSSPAALAAAATPRFLTHHPHMRDAKPLARAHNPLLTTSADPGDDDTAISLDPTLSALCQSYREQLHDYPPPRPNVDAILGDTLVDVGSQAGCATAQDETTIAVNLLDPLNVVAGANDYRLFNSREARNDGSGVAYASFDGGRTWKDTVLPHLTFQTGATGALSDMDSAGDPVVAFGAEPNVVYYANLVFSRLNSASGIVVNVSRDGGFTWGEPSIVHLDGVDASGNPTATSIFNDKEWIAVDPIRGTVYVTWTQFGSSDSPVVVSRSDDQGRSWSAPTRINPAFVPGGITAYSSGTNPQVGFDGALYVAYESAVCATLACDQPTDMDATIVAKSTDGGRSFTSTVVAQNYDFPYNADVGRATLTGENFRINSFPQLALDIWTNTLVVTWADDRNGQYDPTTGASIKTNGDVIVSKSHDGTTWSAPLALGTPADEVYPAVAASFGKVALSFYTRNYDAAGVGLDFAAIAGEYDRLARKSVKRLTTATSNPGVQFVGIGAVTGNVLQGLFIGDYTAVALGWDGVFHPAWTDFRGNPGVTPPNQDVYVQQVRVEDCE
jgi:hypothetical protein